MSRRTAAICALATLALGIASRRVHLGLLLWDKSLGDALYTVMIYFFVAFARPAWTPLRLGAVALGASIAIELFQLTEIPDRLPRPLQIALGTSFAWHDVACYVVGAAAVTIAHALLVRRRVNSTR